MIAVLIDEDLGLVRETAEGGRMDDAVAIALKFAPRRRRRLGDEAAGRAQPRRRHRALGSVRRYTLAIRPSTLRFCVTSIS